MRTFHLALLLCLATTLTPGSGAETETNPTPVLIELFTSADNDSWTMVMTMPAGESCVIAVGEYWLETKRPALDGPAA